MAYTTIDKSSLHFNTKLYTGNNSTNAITGVGFQPDFVWLKPRNLADNHRLMNAVSGADKYLISNSNSGEGDPGSNFASFDSDGFTLGGSDGGWNSSSYNYVAWNWKANGQGSSNTDGSINTTYTSANTTSGFSIVKFTATGSAATVGHGLSAVPKMILVKRTDSSHTWQVYHASRGATKYLELQATQAEQTASNRWNDTAPTTSVFSIGSEWGSGAVLLAYCFAEKTGFSKFGSYVANGSNDGAFCYTGFKPGFIMIKSATTAMYWHIFDKTRLGYNAYNYRLNPNATDVETTTTDVIDILSNGFKIRTNQQQFGTSGATYIYMAFAEAPLVGSNNVPCTAR